MIFNYDPTARLSKIEQVFPHYKLTSLLIAIKNNSKYPTFSDEFYDYLYHTYQIKVTFVDDGRDIKIINTVEIDDATLTMLILMYDNKF